MTIIGLHLVNKKCQSHIYINLYVISESYLPLPKNVEHHPVKFIEVLYVGTLGHLTKMESNVRCIVFVIKIYKITPILFRSYPEINYDKRWFKYNDI